MYWCERNIPQLWFPWATQRWSHSPGDKTCVYILVVELWLMGTLEIGPSVIQKTCNTGHWPQLLVYPTSFIHTGSRLCFLYSTSFSPSFPFFSRLTSASFSLSLAESLPGKDAIERIHVRVMPVRIQMLCNTLYPIWKSVNSNVGPSLDSHWQLLDLHNIEFMLGHVKYNATNYNKPFRKAYQVPTPYNVGYNLAAPW